MVRPLREVGSTIGITQVAILCIRNEPLLGFLEECLELSRSQHILPFLVEDDVQILRLGIVDTLVVDLRQSVEFLTESLKLLALSLIGNRRQLSQVGVLRVESEDRDTAVRIAVGPCMCNRRVVDRQNLQHALMSLCDEVDHLLQIAEVAHAEAVLAPQREHRHLRSGKLQRIDIESCLRQAIDNDIAVLDVNKVDDTVVACLPQRLIVEPLVTDEELELNLFRVEGIGVEVDNPLVIVVLDEFDGMLRYPVAQSVALAYYGEALTLEQLRGTNLQAHGAVERLLLDRDNLRRRDTQGEC